MHVMGSPIPKLYKKSFTYCIYILFYFNDSSFLIHVSVLTSSTNDFLNLSKLSTWEVFENPKGNPLIPKVTI